MDYFGYGEQDVVPCELYGRPAAGVHHIKFKSQGGKDEIENLMALCREHHEDAHKHIFMKNYLKAAHILFLESRKH